MTASLPVLDASQLATDDPSACRDFGERFCTVFAETGFAYLDNHGICDTLIGQMLNENRRFHSLASSRKLAVALNRDHRGYIGPGTSTDRASTLADVTEPNASESFMVMREDALDSPAVLAGKYLAGPNQWPAELPGFRETLERYAVEMNALAEKLLRACAVGLGDSSGDDAPCTLLDDFQPPTTWLRLLRYPGSPAELESPRIGSAAHHDFGAITLLAEDDVGGLEVMSPAGQWVAVEPRPGSFVLNVGEMLHRYSGSLLRATPHRVINRSERERFSVAYFYDPDMNAIVRPLASCRKHAARSVTNEIRFDDFVRRALTQSYDQHADRND